MMLQFVPYTEVEELGSARRVHKLLDIVKQDKVVVLQGRLTKEEEKDLIAITMENINETFKGIELAVIDESTESKDFLKKAKSNFYNFLLGDRRGFTVIGPSSMVKEIKRDPHKIELMTADGKRKKRK